MIAEIVDQVETTELSRRRFTADEYWRILEAGILGEDAAVELIWGEIIEMSPINVPHTLCVNRLNMMLTPRLAEQAIVSVQNPVQIDEYSLPQPDIAVWQLSDEEYDRLADPTELLLVIEVADSSIRKDKVAKAKLYGAAGITDYWIVNLHARRVEVFRDPQTDGYGTITLYGPGKTISPLAFPDMSLSVDAILGLGD